jgi:DNA polymerase-1
MAAPGRNIVDELGQIGVGRGDLLGLAIAPGVGLGMAPAAGREGAGRKGAGFGHGGSLSIGVDDPAAAVRLVEEAIRPRWVLWSNATAGVLVRAGVRIATCWDIAAVHRLVFGGWRADPGRVWAQLQGLGVETVPKATPPDLFSPPDADPDEPVDADGHLRPEWVNGGWCASPLRWRRWAELASEVAILQLRTLAGLADRPMAEATARSESAAELLCAEMSVDGLPMDRAVMEEIIAASVGPRPRNEAEAVAYRAQRDGVVISHIPPGIEIDLRSPGQVKTLLANIGIDVPDTRAARLRTIRDQHPLIDALLVWRKAERIATTYGYAWLDSHVDGDGRLRGEWTGSDGAAGRMTASGGLHNMPAEMRGAVIAEPGRVFVRADLGQIEPRVLAAVSGDRALARATAADDMYAPVAAQLGVDRATAKVAVLGAMYGQTTGHGAQALRRLKIAYPVAMAYLDEADVAGQVSRDLRTYGGRLIAMGSTNANEVSDQAARSRAAARGRYGRNALVQGAAAELFKVWAVTVRARADALSARIVLCLHDELLVHVPLDHADAVARLLDDCLQEAAHRWAPDHGVRFVADIAVLSRWADAKA